MLALCVHRFGIVVVPLVAELASRMAEYLCVGSVLLYTLSSFGSLFELSETVLW